MDKIIFLIPAFNEEKNLKKVILQFKKYGSIFVINDGSTDKTEEIAKKNSKYYLKNFRNRGYDYSLQRGLKFISKNLNFFEHVITIDADGQHKLNQLPKIIKQLKRYDVVMGNRNFYNRPVEKKICNISKKKFKIADPLSGMKGYRVKILKKNLPLIKKKINYYGMFFLEWINNISSINVNITVNKKNKQSSMGENKEIEAQFLNNFLKILKVRHKKS